MRRRSGPTDLPALSDQGFLVFGLGLVVAAQANLVLVRCPIAKAGTRAGFAIEADRRGPQTHGFANNRQRELV